MGHLAARQLELCYWPRAVAKRVERFRLESESTQLLTTDVAKRRSRLLAVADCELLCEVGPALLVGQRLTRLLLQQPARLAGLDRAEVLVVDRDKQDLIRIDSNHLMAGLEEFERASQAQGLVVSAVLSRTIHRDHSSVPCTDRTYTLFRNPDLQKMVHLQYSINTTYCFYL